VQGVPNILHLYHENKHRDTPHYLSFTILSTGIALVANTVRLLLLLPAVQILMSRGVIAQEEQYLERTFGGEYTRYKARVRRWL
jgi:protein-S-isoprenylcysteine O-methyltransferase Ste14